jgi:zinc transporter 1/2/3
LSAAAGFCLILILERGLFAGINLDEEAGTTRTLPSVSPYILAVALSVHSVLAGIALGAEQTILGASALLIAVLAHKGSAAFALAVSFHGTSVSRAFITRLIIGFSLATPMGLLLGSVLTDWLGAGSGRIFEAVFDSLAAGTFVYVASMDIIREEFFETTKNRWIKLLLLAAGLVFMALLALFL